MGRREQGVEASRDRYHVVPRTLCFVTHGDDVLLLRGAPDKRIWPNRYNGVGGHLERDEDVFSAALREIREETGLDVRDLRLRGLINVDAGDPQLGILVFVFTAVAAERAARRSEEGHLQWLPCEEVLNYEEFAAQTVEDLPIILPHVLGTSADEPLFFAHYSYDEQDQLIITMANR